jgi:UDP-glucose 4-epimerase
MVSEEEAWRTYVRGAYYAIKAMLPELVKKEEKEPALTKEYSSNSDLMNLEETIDLLRKNNLMADHEIMEKGNLLR